MDFLAGLNPNQREAAEHFEGPLLILAGAGSGKTRVITHRICHLIQARGVPGGAILAVTFTNKAAGEMRDRVMRLLGWESAMETPVISTFHSFSVRLLRRDGDALQPFRPGFTRNFQIYDDDDQVAVLKRVYKKLGIGDEFLKPRAALSIISHGKNLRQTPQDFYEQAHSPPAERLAKVYEEYENGLREANALDFDDLLLEGVRLLRQDEATREWYGRRFRFLMVDEYQDTNRTQYELLRLLATRHSNVAVVGDEDQSIYGWRGADIRNILDFEQDFPGARVIRLEQNYRSTKTILDAAGAVVANNTARKGKWLWTEAGAGTPIGVFEADDGEQEALFIAETIDKLLRSEPQSHVAVLYRTNSQSRQIEEALRRYGRKYKVVGGFSFYQRAEVKDALAYVKLLLNPRDNVALLRILNVPARGLGKTSIEQLEKLAGERRISLWEAIAQGCDEHLYGARAGAALGAFRSVVEQLREALPGQAPHATLRRIVEETGYGAMLQADPSPEAESKLGNLQELVSAAADAAARGESMEEFLDHAALVSDADQVDETAPVSLLTMHNAKGLEFPVVFIAGVEEGLFPHSRSRDNEEQLEEERRLCYVAMTRARKRLYVSHARYRRRYGGSPSEPCTPSRFLKEIPTHLTEILSGRPADPYQVELSGEQQMVREAARRNTYTGKTYNSLDHISQFFAERGIQTNLPRPATPVRAVETSHPGGARVSGPAPQPQVGPAAGAAKAANSPAKHGELTARSASFAVNSAAGPKPAAPGKRGGAIRAGATVSHPKYGQGLVLRKEGEGEDAKITVSFSGHGLKKLVARYASLKVLD
jgi:DNA helicase-2/ATP-dependent DNA helicase PcrA